MPRVKQPIIASVLIIAVGGCTQLELARFAPPGIIKYEDLAGDQPPNPAIEERIESRKIDADAKFPVLSRTPGEDDRPVLRPEAERTAQLEELVSRRDQLQAAADADRTAAEGEIAAGALLPKQRDKLKDQADIDAAIVRRKREQLAPPGDVRPD